MAVPDGALLRRSNSASVNRGGGHNTEMRLRMRKESERKSTRKRGNSMGTSTPATRRAGSRKKSGKFVERKPVDPNATSPPPWHVLSIISDLTEEKLIDSDDSTDTNSKYDENENEDDRDDWACDSQFEQQAPIPPPSINTRVAQTPRSPVTPRTTTRVFSTSVVKKTPRIRKKSHTAVNCPTMSPNSKSFLDRFPLLQEAMSEYDITQKKSRKPPKGYVYEDTLFYRAQATYFKPKCRGTRKKKKSSSTSHCTSLPMCVYDSAVNGGTPSYRLHTVSSSGLYHSSAPPTRGKSPVFARARTDVFSKPMFQIHTSQELLFDVSSPRTTSPRSVRSPFRKLGSIA